MCDDKVVYFWTGTFMLECLVSTIDNLIFVVIPVVYLSNYLHNSIPIRRFDSLYKYLLLVVFDHVQITS